MVHGTVTAKYPATAAPPAVFSATLPALRPNKSNLRCHLARRDSHTRQHACDCAAGGAFSRPNCALSRARCALSPSSSAASAFARSFVVVGAPVSVGVAPVQGTAFGCLMLVLVRVLARELRPLRIAQGGRLLHHAAICHVEGIGGPAPQVPLARVKEPVLRRRCFGRSCKCCRMRRTRKKMSRVVRVTSVWLDEVVGRRRSDEPRR